MAVPDQPHVRVTPDARDGRVVTAVSGEVDAATADDFEAQLRPAIAESTDVVLDLTEVSFMDSSGLRALVAIHHEVAERGGTIELAGTSNVVERLLSVTGLAELFTRAG